MSDLDHIIDTRSNRIVELESKISELEKKVAEISELSELRLKSEQKYAWMSLELKLQVKRYEKALKTILGHEYDVRLAFMRDIAKEALNAEGK